MVKKGLVFVFTGDGKGKTTAAVGQAVRAFGRGWKVLLIQFIKEVVSGEVEPLRRLGIEVYPMGAGYVGILTDRKEKEAHIQAAERALDFAKERAGSGGYDLLVLDEINNAVSLGLLDAKEVLKFLRERPRGLSVILTGRGAPKEFIEMADLVSEITEIRHPFRKGKRGERGIEF
ncbi:MAG: cob(I)yrinic acid a,c-diamide adenosyltransferase [Patescibacteria group bacterium]|nr:MAG: cob(I)yrinic acid a,c-diamide adenosyltransferase [Patescibacteria group bacterium]